MLFFIVCILASRAPLLIEHTYFMSKPFVKLYFNLLLNLRGNLILDLGYHISQRQSIVSDAKYAEHPARYQISGNQHIYQRCIYPCLFPKLKVYLPSVRSTASKAVR